MRLDKREREKRKGGGLNSKSDISFEKDSFITNVYVVLSYLIR